MNGSLFIDLGVVPILIGPLQVFLAMLPAILLGLGSALLALFKPATFKLALRLLWRMKLSVLLALAVIGGTVAGARAVWRGTTGAVGHAETGAQDWPLFRGGLRRTGAASGDSVPLRGGINWAFASEAKSFHASPAVVGNRVYITSAEVGVFSNRGAIYCLDADTGGVVWKCVPEGFRATFSSPSISGKYLITGEGLHQVRDGRIVCLDVTRGVVLWTFRTKSHVESSAAIADGRAIIGAGDDGYYCFRLEPDAQGNPVMLWHLAGRQYPDAENDPIVFEGRAYLGLGIGGHAIVCVNAETGRELWRIATPSPVFAPPMMARGKLFIGMGHANFVETEEQVIAGELERLRAAGRSAAEIEATRKDLKPGGEVWCIDLATKQVDWRFQTDSTVLGAIVASDDRLFVSARGGIVYSLGFDGKTLATWHARAPLIASLAVASAHVYGVTQGGRLFALEQAGLQPVWEVSLGASGDFLSSPVIARGHVYTGSPENGLLCVGQPFTEHTPRIWPGSLGGAGVGGNLENTSLPPKGEVLWWSAEYADDEVNPPGAVIAKTLYLAQGPLFRRGVARLDLENPAPIERWFFPTKNTVKQSPGATSELVAFSEASTDQEPGRLHVLRASDGAESWSVEIAPGAYGFASIAGEAILAEERPGWLSAYDHRGHLRWRERYSSAEGEHVVGVPAVRDQLIVIASLFRLAVLDELSGKELWSQPLEWNLGGPILCGNSILLASQEGLCAYRLRDGQMLYDLPLKGEIITALVRVGELVAATTRPGELVLIDPAAGKVVARHAGADEQIPPLPLPDGQLFATREGIARVDLATQTVTPWLTLKEGERVNSPLFVAGSSVCFFTNLRLVQAGKREE